MSNNRCLSCDHENSGSQVYCGHCGAILAKAPQKNDGDPLPTAVAVAARRARPVDLDSDNVPERSFLSRFFGFCFYLVSVVVGVMAVLLLLDPNAPSPAGPSIPNASVAIERAFLGSRYRPVSISQPLINQALLQANHSGWRTPFPLIPVPKWNEAWVLLAPGIVRYSLSISFLDHPLYFTESFHLQGSAGRWSLVADSGSIGLLPINGPFLRLLTPFMKGSLSTFDSDLNTLELADSLRIVHGAIEFSTH